MIENFTMQRRPASGVEYCCIHQIVLEQAARTPDRIAIRCASTALTYKMLAQKVGSLARYLRSRGVGPGCPVGVLLPRTEALPVASQRPPR